MTGAHRCAVAPIFPITTIGPRMGSWKSLKTASSLGKIVVTTNVNRSDATRQHDHRIPQRHPDRPARVGISTGVVRQALQRDREPPRPHPRLDQGPIERREAVPLRGQGLG